MDNSIFALYRRASQKLDVEWPSPLQPRDPPGSPDSYDSETVSATYYGFRDRANIVLEEATV